MLSYDWFLLRRFKAIVDYEAECYNTLKTEFGTVKHTKKGASGSQRYGRVLSDDVQEANTVRTMKQVHDFATKWIDKFRDQEINYIELVDHNMADDCAALGFQMDCGHAQPVSDRICHGHCPEPDEETEQHIAIHSKPDLVKRVEILYHRITKTRLKIPTSKTIEYAVWDYTESMVIDSDSDTIEHIQNIGTGCSVTRTYKVGDGVKSLLEDLNVNTLFGHIEGNPEDVFVDPLESRDYSIRVLTQKGKETILQGTYDKKGLPDDWAEFIDSVFEFLTFYGWGEIMNPSVYGKVRRTSRDIIYCSVTFQEGYKDYYYITDDDSIEVGDFVLAPAGADNHKAIVKVVKKEYFPEDRVPLPLDKTKHIIRKCTDDDFDLMD